MEKTPYTEFGNTSESIASLKEKLTITILGLENQDSPYPTTYCCNVVALALKAHARLSAAIGVHHSSAFLFNITRNDNAGKFSVHTILLMV